MRYCLLLLALLSGLPALAQSPTAPAAPGSLAVSATPAAPDTAAAIHRLFAHKRQKRTNRLILVAGVTVVGIGSSASEPASRLKNDMLAVTGVLAGVGMLAVGLIYNKFSQKREQQALAAFAAHRLAPGIRRKLTSRYFQVPRSNQ